MKKLESELEREKGEITPEAIILGLELTGNNHKTLQELLKGDNIKAEYWQGIRDAILVYNRIVIKNQENKQDKEAK